MEMRRRFWRELVRSAMSLFVYGFGGAAVLILGLAEAPDVFATLLDSISEVRYESYVVTTTAGQSTATVVLPEPPIYLDKTRLHVTSDLASDMPVVAAFDSATRQVTVDGLTPSTTRTITVTYDAIAPGRNILDITAVRIIAVVYVLGMLALSCAMVTRAITTLKEV